VHAGAIFKKKKKKTSCTASSALFMTLELQFLNQSRECAAASGEMAVEKRLMFLGSDD
jgi:hypothetical protein